MEELGTGELVRMKIQYFIAAFAVLSIVITTCILVYWKLAQNKRKRTKAQNFLIYNKRFNFYHEFFISRKTFKKIYEQITSLSMYDFQEGRITAVKFYESSLKLALILFMVGLIGFGDIIAAVVMVLYASIIQYTLVIKNINAVNREATKQLTSYITSLSQTFTRTRNIPDALYDTQAPPLLKLSIDKIYNIVTANNGRELLTQFYQEIQNRSLRTLATTCYIRNDAGEEDAKGTSPFKQALTLIREDAVSQKKLQLNQYLMFKLLDALPLVPIVLYPVLRIIYEKMIAGTISVFQSTTGYIIKLVILFSSFLCYYIITTINNESVARTDDRLEFITKMLQSRRISRFARTLIPHKFKVRRDKQKMLNSCLSSKTLEYLYLEKLVFGLIAVTVAVASTVAILFITRATIYDSLSVPSMTTTLKYTAEEKAKTLEYDHYVLGLEKCPSEEEIRKAVKGIFRTSSELTIDAHVNRVVTKYKNYNNLKFHWYLAFVYIIAFFAGRALSEFMLTLRAKLVRSEAELDVLQLQTIIAILMDTTLDTMSVIYWLSKSSDIHKDALTYCYNEFAMDPMKALRRLQSKSAIPEFTALCDTLKTTVYQVSLAEAFEDLVSERRDTLETRDTLQLNTLQTKRTIAGPIALAPTIVLIIFEFLLPIGIVAYMSAKDTVSKLQM